MHAAGAVLPAIGLVLLYAALRRSADGEAARTRTMISATIWWGVVVLVVTELLSAIHAVAAVPLAVTWIGIDAALAIVVVRTGALSDVRGLRRPSIRDVTVAGAAVALACVVVAAVTALIALVAPPNDWDAMSYHMARIAHWISDRSVAFFPSLYAAQLYQGPWSSYLGLHLTLLAGDDRFVNLIQWFAFIGSALVVARIASQLGGSRRAQLLSASFVFAVPMAILQASSAQDHLVVTFWLCCLASLVLDLRDRIDVRTTAEVGACLGLAILTKSTTYVLASPFVLGAAVLAWRRVGVAGVARLAVSGAMVAGINVVHWYRNVAAFGSPLGDPVETGWHVMRSFNPVTFAERLVQESSLQLSLPDPMRSTAERVLRVGSSRIGLDLDDPRTIIGTRWSIPPLTTHEDYTGNLIAAAVIVLVVAAVVVRGPRQIRGYVAALVAAYLLFVGATRWEFYDSRLLLPLFALSAPIVGLVLGERLGSMHRAGPVAALAMVVAAGPWLFLGAARPLVGAGSVLTTPRMAQYFVNRPELEAPYRDVAGAILASSCRKVGMTVTGNDPWEYPMWALLTEGRQEIVLTAVDAVARTRALSGISSTPCAIVAVGFADVPSRVTGGLEYRRIRWVPPVELFLAPTPATARTIVGVPDSDAALNATTGDVPIRPSQIPRAPAR